MNPLRYVRDAMSAIIGAALAAACVVVVYEGVPIGPLRYIPGIHYVIPEGRVASERRKALAGYVLQSELDAERARREEIERQLRAGRVALDGYAVLLQEAQEIARAADEADAKDKADYEAKLRMANRYCPLDQSDIDWLRR